MSYGTRKAIAGMIRSGQLAHDACMEYIRMFDACQTAADIRDVLDDAKKRGGLFLRTSEDDRSMRDAYEKARARVAATAPGTADPTTPAAPSTRNRSPST